MPFEPLWKMIVVGVVPQPRQVPPVPFPAEDLQRLYFDVTREHPFQQFALLPGESGAQFNNGPDDVVTVQPVLLQIQTRVDLTPGKAREKCASILRMAFSRLKVETFLQCGVKVVAHVPAPGSTPDAKVFITERLMRGDDHIKELGADFFGGGVKYRSIGAGREDNLLVEPLVQDNHFLFVDYDVARAPVAAPMSSLDDVSTWIDEAFSFVSSQAMRLLEV